MTNPTSTSSIYMSTYLYILTSISHTHPLVSTNMVSASHPTHTWDVIQTVFYRKEQVYELSWHIPGLEDYRVAAAKFGGPIGTSVSQDITPSSDCVCIPSSTAR